MYLIQTIQTQMCLIQVECNSKPNYDIAFKCIINKFWFLFTHGNRLLQKNQVL